MTRRSEYIASQRARQHEGLPIDDAISVVNRGAIISTSGTSATVAIPDSSIGAPRRVRLAATAACYVRLGTPDEASAAVAAAGTGYVIGEVLTVVGGTATTPMTVEVATGQLISVAGNALGSGYDVDQVITLGGGTATTAATLTLTHVQLASLAINAAGTGYAVGQVATMAGGTAATAAEVTVTATKVVSATVDVGGSGDLADGAGVIVEGTTGTGTKFRASVTIAGNAIASVQSITVAGAYTVDPTDIAHEPVTYISGAGGGTTLTGAQLAIVLGVSAFSITERGDYTVISATFTQTGATSPAGGTGATWQTASYAPLTWTVSEAGSYSVLPTSFTQTGATAPAGGTGATFNTPVWGVDTVDVIEAGAYTVDPSNPVATTSDGSGTNATLTVTMVTAAAAGDMLIPAGGSVVVDALGFDHVAAIQVSGGGVLQISPLED